MKHALSHSLYALGWAWCRHAPRDACQSEPCACTRIMEACSDALKQSLRAAYARMAVAFLSMRAPMASLHSPSLWRGFCLIQN